MTFPAPDDSPSIDRGRSTHGDRAEALRRLVTDCLARQAAGVAIDEDALIAAHPELMPELACQLAKFRAVARAWQQSTESSESNRRAVSSLGSEAGNARSSSAGHLRIRCPKCHAPTEISTDTSWENIACGACGLRFSLVENESDSFSQLARIGHFELVERVGAGGFGIVWKAYDHDLRRHVAIKVPRRRGFDPGDGELLLREARAAARLHHPHIVTVHEVGRLEDRIYIVSDFVEGGSLREWLVEHRMTAHEAARFCLVLAQALEHAHAAGVIHRDLKPANILLDTGGAPHVTDFGLARREGANATVSDSGEVVGTPAYMSPEQARGDSKRADQRSDIYSLGVILFELLTDKVPFQGPPQSVLTQILEHDPPDPRGLRESVPPDLATVCLKCLEKDPARRYDSAHALADDLNRFLTGRDILARRASPWERSWRWCRRNPAATAILVSLTLGVVAIVWQWRDARHTQLQAEMARTAALTARQNERMVLRQAEARAEEFRQRQERTTNYSVLIAEARTKVADRAWDEAFTLYSQAIEIDPHLEAARIERGELFMTLFLPDRAAEDLQQAFTMRRSQPYMESWKWFRQAILRLHIGDFDGYQRTYDEMFQTFQGTGGAGMQTEMARIFVLSPAMNRDMNRLVTILEKNGARDPWSLRVLGSVYYRAGRYEEAIATCRESLSSDPVWNPREDNYSILAMAYYRLNRMNESQDALRFAKEFVDREINVALENIETPWRRRRADEMPHDVIEFQIHFREAQMLLGITPRNDYRMHLLRARALGLLRLLPEADDEYAIAMKLSPDDESIRQEAERVRDLDLHQQQEKRGRARPIIEQARLKTTERKWYEAMRLYDQVVELCPELANPRYERGDLFVSLYLVDRAVSEYKQAFNLRRPTIDWQWFRQALILLRAGDFDGYQITCDEMLKQLQEQGSCRSRVELVRAIVLSPHTKCDLDRIVSLAEGAVSQYRVDGDAMEPWVPAWALRVLATAYYRAGRYEEAIATCNESLISDPNWEPRRDNYSILAMAYHRLNRTSESRDALRLAAEFMDQRINQMLTQIGDQPVWYDSYEYELHFREAQELLGVEPQDYRRHLLSARALALLRLKQEALDEYAMVIKLNPDDASIRLEAERLGGP